MFFSVVATGFLTGAGLIMAIGTQNAFVLRQGLERSHVGLVVAIPAIALLNFLERRIDGAQYGDT